MADHRTNVVFLTTTSVINFTASIPSAFFSNNTITSNGQNFQGVANSSAGNFTGPKPGSSFNTGCHVNTPALLRLAGSTVNLVLSP